MSSSPSPTSRTVPRIVLARAIKRDVLNVEGVLAFQPRLFQRLGRAPGVRIRRRAGALVSVKVWIGVVHDAGAVIVAKRVQDAVLDAVRRTSGEIPGRVIVVIARFKVLRSPQKRGKGEMT